MQTAYEIGAFKKTAESNGKALSAKEITAAFQTHGKRVKDNEDFTVTFVQSALVVYETICCEPRLVAILHEFESLYSLQSCLNSITKLHDFVRKTTTTDEREWVLHGILDLIQDKKVRNEDVSRTVLTGGAHAAGLVQMLLLKQRVLQTFLNLECTKAGFDTRDQQKIQVVLGSHEAYRSSVAALPGRAEPDVSWIGRLRESSVKVLRLLEAACPLHPTRLRSVLQSHMMLLGTCN
jgi:hypothetical protein